jgi:3-isopropylmalate/(R)-2-methylmalate dehydratase small subunit
VAQVTGRGLALRGDDIDTDRIMPARFLKAVSFEGTRAPPVRGRPRRRPAPRVRRSPLRGASILIVNANFGCGSSREHAPQGLARAGFRAMIGRSFSEIFQGNSAMLGVPCFVAGGAEIERLQALVEATPEADSGRRRDRRSHRGSLRWKRRSRRASRRFPLGQWNPTAMLLQDFDEVRAVAARLALTDRIQNGNRESVTVI